MRHNGPLQDPSNLYVLIPNLISQIAILLVKLCLIPTIASTFLLPSLYFSSPAQAFPTCCLRDSQPDCLS